MHLTTIQNEQFVFSRDVFPDTADSLIHQMFGLIGEVGECANWYKKFTRGDMDYNDLLDELVKELPDVLIYLVNVANILGINLELAYQDKHQYNIERFVDGRSLYPSVSSD